jgi:polyferredoxin
MLTCTGYSIKTCAKVSCEQKNNVFRAFKPSIAVKNPGTRLSIFCRFVLLLVYWGFQHKFRSAFCFSGGIYALVGAFSMLDLGALEGQWEAR